MPLPKTNVIPTKRSAWRDLKEPPHCRQPARFLDFARNDSRDGRFVNRPYE